MFSRPGEIEATAKLAKRDDGWRIQFHFDNGTFTEQDNPPFTTLAEAEAALAEYMAEVGIRSVGKMQ